MNDQVIVRGQVYPTPESINVESTNGETITYIRSDLTQPETQTDADFGDSISDNVPSINPLSVPSQSSSYTVQVHGQTYAGVRAIEAYDPTNERYVSFGAGASQDGDSDNGGVRYVSTDGDDENDGLTASRAMATVNAALESGGRHIVLAPGIYEQTINLANVKYGDFSMQPQEINNRVIFRPGNCIAAESAVAVSGYTKVYSFPLEYAFAANNIYIFQDGIADEKTEILAEERHPLQRGYRCRCGDTAIRKTTATTLSDALSEIETAETYKWFSDGSTVYLSCPEVVSTDHPICISRGGALFSNANRSITLNLTGIESKYQQINVNNTCASVLKNCKCTNVYGDGCFTFNGALAVEFRKCEAARGFNGTNGDGFNGHSGDNGDPFAYQTNAVFIDCWSHDNRDDGSSDHERCESTYIGGLYEYNGYGAGVTPAYGSHTTCNGVYSRKNGDGGFMYSNLALTAEGGVGGQMICYGCVAENNNTWAGHTPAGFDLRGNNNHAILINCASIGNPKGFNIASASSLMTIINSSSINCSSDKAGQVGNYTVLNGSIITTDKTLTIEGESADAKATGDALAEAADARAELRARLLQTASAVTPLVLTADAIDDNPGTVLMPDGSTAATASAIGTSDAYACKTGQTLTYTLSTQAGRLVFAVYDAAGNLTHGVEGNGYSAYISGEYTFGANDAYFRVGGVTGGNYRKNYALSYSYALPNVATKMDIEVAAEDRANIRNKTLQVSEALNISGLSWNNLPTEYYSGDSYTNNGITFTRNVDGFVHSEGTATDQARYYWLYKYGVTPGTYTLGGIPAGAGMQSFALQYAITAETPGSGDYHLILADTEITVPQGHFLSIRSWYKKGYVDEGHDWNVFLGKNIGEMDSKANPKNFVPVIYKNQKAVQELRGHTLPAYWETYLQEKAADIRNAVRAVGNHGVVFQFFTDFHRPQSDVNYRGYTTLPQLLAYVKKRCFVDDVIFGGDVLQKNATAEEAAAVLEQYAQEFAELKPLNIVGNHDGNRYGGDPAGSAPVGADTLYSILFRGMEGRVRMGPGPYWYRDNDAQKVRLIALNTGTDALSEWNADAAQHRWLADTLSSTPEGYTLIVIPHVFFQMSGGALALSTIGRSVKAIVDAYAARSSGTWQGVSYDFTHAGGTVACILCGHAHNDGVIVSEAGYPMIGTVCEAMWGSQQTIARGTQAKQTTNEHAFDVVCLDTGSKTIKCIRVGSGSDRTYTYISDSISPMPEETVEVTVPDSGNVFVTIDAGKIYHFVGDLISLELELGPLSGGSRQYHFDFISGDTPPTLTFTEGLIPTAVIMPDGFEIEANRRYEVDIMNGYGVVQEWTT